MRISKLGFMIKLQPTRNRNLEPIWGKSHEVVDKHRLLKLYLNASHAASAVERHDANTHIPLQMSSWIGNITRNQP